ncbi:MAG TPA: hypothetical protein VKC59_02110 [Candidatus Limnocylindrales bacterium]|nr:hypothetical protein [Candidatus Limnocylindrales bacterium]
MAEPLIAESLPELYRQVLDRVAALEQHDMRDEAALVRTRAIRIYSGAWTETAQRRLRAVRIHAERVLAGYDRPRSRRPVAVLLDRLTVVRPG